MKNIVNKSPSVPRLLVSVRNLAEASIAIEGGCDILDLKEPSRGSLGMVEPKIAAEAVSGVGNKPVSVALGELSDWQDSETMPVVPPGASFCKLGLSGQALNSRWKQDWRNFRNRVDGMSGGSHRWIAVVYADFQLANSPAPEEILEVAASTGCAGVLFDTFSKADGSLFDCVSLDELSLWAAQIRSNRMLFALAGSLRIEHVPQILPLQPDIVAVRGAVCSDHLRTSGIEAVRVRKLKQVLEHTPTRESLIP
ncbi:MAG TPA: (5-formylfuran-3-yl)methyl phosphate synthase [Planctomycetaceae bacterium]|nr:(5-formylfuran-3-yl)methyl phosphate synthase [Planctomycetaceae bacterium]